MNQTVEDMNNLRHMLGCETCRPKKEWGYRNFFDASESDLPSMLRLEALGLAERRKAQWGNCNMFFATEDGRAAVGLDEKQYQRKRA